MNTCIRHLLVPCFALALSAATLADSIELRLKDGSRWRGETSDYVEIRFMQGGVEVPFAGQILDARDLYLVVEGEELGKVQKKTIFKSDIVAIKSSEGSPTVSKSAGSPATAPTTEIKPAGTITSSTTKVGADGTPVTLLKAEKPGVFVLPLDGMVGLEFRHQEMEAVAKEADKYGDGQIIVFIINSGGGRVTEMETIHKTMTEIKKRHRLVAWIKDAISAACATAMHCHEIYFMTEGTAGAMTAFGGTQSWQGEELERWMKEAGDWMEQGGRSRYIAEAMIHAPELVSYDKDPVTGDVTWYDDLSGEFVLSDEKTNLCFNATNGVHSGWVDGIADTKEELAKHLDLPGWYEINSYGRDLHDDWKGKVEKAQKEIPLLFARYGFKNTSTGDAAVILGTRISIIKDLIGWWDRCPNACEMQGLPPKEQLEREIANMRKELADIKKAR